MLHFNKCLNINMLFPKRRELLYYTFSHILSMCGYQRVSHPWGGFLLLSCQKCLDMSTAKLRIREKPSACVSTHTQHTH